MPIRSARPRILHSLFVAAIATVLPLTTAAVAAGQPLEASQAVVRNGNQWFLADELGARAAAESFFYGSRRDSIHVLGDWDGDHVRSPGIVRADRESQELVWYLRNSNSSGVADTVVRFGAVRGPESIDTPIVGDWDGDGTETVGFVRADYDRNLFEWHLRNSNSTGPADVVFTYGRPHNYGQLDPRSLRGTPVTGDWDGDGTTTIGVVVQHPREGGASRWQLGNSNAGGVADLDFRYGSADDVPLAGDWDGDGTTTPGVWRFPNRWYVRNANSSGTADVSFRYGKRGDLPVVWGQPAAGSDGPTETAWSQQSVSVDGTATARQAAALLSLDVGAASDYDTLDLGFVVAGGIPDVTADYTDGYPTAPGSDEPVELEGNRFVKLTLDNVDPSSVTDVAAPTSFPGTISDVQILGGFEGSVEIGVGLSTATGTAPRVDIRLRTEPGAGIVHFDARHVPAD